MDLPKIENVIEFRDSSKEIAIIFRLYEEQDRFGMLRLMDGLVEMYGLVLIKGHWCMAGEEPEVIPVTAFFEMARALTKHALEQALWGLESDGDPIGAMDGLIALLGYDPTGDPI